MRAMTLLCFLEYIRGRANKARLPVNAHGHLAAEWTRIPAVASMGEAIPAQTRMMTISDIYDASIWLWDVALLGWRFLADWAIEISGGSEPSVTSTAHCWMRLLGRRARAEPGGAGADSVGILKPPT